MRHESRFESTHSSDLSKQYSSHQSVFCQTSTRIKINLTRVYLRSYRVNLALRMDSVSARSYCVSSLDARLRVQTKFCSVHVRPLYYCYCYVKQTASLDGCTHKNSFLLFTVVMRIFPFVCEFIYHKQFALNLLD